MAKFTVAQGAIAERIENSPQRCGPGFLESGPEYFWLTHHSTPVARLIAGLTRLKVGDHDRSLICEIGWQMYCAEITGYGQSLNFEGAIGTNDGRPVANRLWKRINVSANVQLTF